MTSVERVKEYINLEPEAALECAPDKQPPADWPQKGCIEAKGVNLKYSKDGATVLKNLNFSVQMREKVTHCLALNSLCSYWWDVLLSSYMLFQGWNCWKNRSREELAHHDAVPLVWTWGPSHHWWHWNLRDRPPWFAKEDLNDSSGKVNTSKTGSASGISLDVSL